jgi:glucokinase
MTADFILALDFGGTKHAAALLRHGDQSWCDVRRRLSPATPDATYDIETMLALARALVKGRRVAAVGVSFGGPVDFERGVVRLSHHVPGWEQFPLAARLTQALGAPVVVDNDANVAALGEHVYGAGQGARHLLFITVSTGVGGGWILNGEPWRGAEGMAGEIGHTVVVPEGPLCLCGKRGCVERLASGPYMARDARDILERDPARGGILRALVAGDLTRIDGSVLSQAAARGDPVASGMLRRGAQALGTGIGNAANLVNPERVILGGGVTHAGVRWWEDVRAATVATLLPEVHVELLPAALGDEAPLWGAIALAQHHLDGAL